METSIYTERIDPAFWENGMSYLAYRQLIDELLIQDKTTGPNQSAELTQYTRMNVQRMQRIDKQAQISNELQQILTQLPLEMYWLVITEGWCGDAAQIVPWLQKMADSTPQIQIKYLLRDEHTALMDAFLTNGGRAIPKLIALDPLKMQVLGHWGPRPLAAQQLYMGLKQAQLPFLEASTQLHKWYADNKGSDIQLELQSALREWQSKQS